jgi:pimeloyl-ACP methyl ester carboxylesterase
MIKGYRFSIRWIQFVLIFLSAYPALLAAQAQIPSQFPGGTAEKIVTVYGLKIRYFEAGNGPAVILLHGLGGESSNWAATISPLSQKYRVIVPDQIGFGRSDKPFINYRVGTLVDFLYGLYKELKIERASLIGNSLGGWTAASFALAYPEKVEKLVLVDAAGFAIPENVDLHQLYALNPSTREGIRQSLALIFYNKIFYTSDVVIDFLFTQKMMAGDGYSTQRFLESIARREDVLDNRLGSIKQPTLIIWGREDGLLPLAYAERFKKEISGAELVIIDQCGHVPQVEKAAEFNAALLKFLAEGTSSLK